MSRGIRRYGPGKFNTILDSYVYQAIGQGSGFESCGDVGEVGFYAESIQLGDDEALKELEKIAAETGDKLTDEERELVLESDMALMVENDQGFVTVDYYEDQDEYDADWTEVEKDASPSAEDEEEEAEAD